MSDQPTLQTVVTDSLARLDFGATDPLPEKFGKDYRALHNHYIERLGVEVGGAPPITDKASYEANQKLRTRLVRVRTGLDATRKALFDPMRQLKAEVDAYIGTTSDAGLQGRLKALERVLEEKQAAWDAEQERIRQEAALKVQQRNEARGRRLIEAGMVFTGACYELPGLKVWPADIANPDDAAFDEWFAGVVLPASEAKREADRLMAEDNLRKARAQELTDTGIVDYLNAEKRIHSFDHPDGTTHIVEAELGTMHEDKWQQWITMARTEAKRRKDEKARSQQEEHDRMQAEFKRQAEVQRKQDDERAAIDAERAKLKAEKQRVRHERLIALGAEYDGRGFYHVGGNLCQVAGNLADLKDEDWVMAQEAVPRAKERWDALCAEKMRMNKQVVERGERLAILGAERDETGTWTLGNATTTHHLLAGMSAEDWNAALTMFEAEADAQADAQADDLPISTAPDEADLRELHACALSLLDEANKAFTILGKDERYSEALAKVQAHAGDCVRITRDLQ